jgi:single-stranded-DNA-specific exonuclease
VVGIVASRLVDVFYRPTFVLAKGEREYHGSARSIAGFELHLAIEHVRDLLTSGGGHAMAGGVKLPHGNLEAFRERLNAYGVEWLSEEMLVPVLKVDGVIELAECVPGVVKGLERLAPFGRGNPRPRFLLEGVRLTAPPRRVGSTGAHVQMTIGKNGRVGRAIAFKMGAIAEQLRVGEELNLVVEPKVDVFNGREKVDLVICDVARCSGEAFEVIGGG